MEGLAIKNDQGKYILHSETPSLYFLGKLAPVNIDVTHLPYSHLVSPEYRNYTTITYRSTYNVSGTPSVFYPFISIPTSNGERVAFNIVSYGVTGVGNNTCELTATVIVSSQDLDGIPALYAYTDTSSIIGYDTYGIVTTDKEGKITFDSSKQPLIVMDTELTPFPRRVDAAAAYNSINLDPINYGMVSHTLSSDSIVFCSTQADGGEVRKYTDEGTDGKCRKRFGIPTGHYKYFNGYVGFAYYKGVFLFKGTHIYSKYIPINLAYDKVEKKKCVVDKQWYNAVENLLTDLIDAPRKLLVEGCSNPADYFNATNDFLAGTFSDGIPRVDITLVGNTTRNSSNSSLILIAKKPYV